MAEEVRRLATKTAGASKLTAELVEKNSDAVSDGSEFNSPTPEDCRGRRQTGEP